MVFLLRSFTFLLLFLLPFLSTHSPFSPRAALARVRGSTSHFSLRPLPHASLVIVFLSLSFAFPAFALPVVEACPALRALCQSGTSHLFPLPSPLHLLFALSSPNPIPVPFLASLSISVPFIPRPFHPEARVPFLNLYEVTNSKRLLLLLVPSLHFTPFSLSPHHHLYPRPPSLLSCLDLPSTYRCEERGTPQLLLLHSFLLSPCRPRPRRSPGFLECRVVPVGKSSGGLGEASTRPCPRPSRPSPPSLPLPFSSSSSVLRILSEVSTLFESAAGDEAAPALLSPSSSRSPFTSFSLSPHPHPPSLLSCLGLPCTYRCEERRGFLLNPFLFSPSSSHSHRLIVLVLWLPLRSLDSLECRVLGFWGVLRGTRRGVDSSAASSSAASSSSLHLYASARIV